MEVPVGKLSEKLRKNSKAFPACPGILSTRQTRDAEENLDERLVGMDPARQCGADASNQVLQVFLKRNLPVTSLEGAFRKHNFYFSRGSAAEVVETQG